jgi:hypothetical protein
MVLGQKAEQRRPFDRMASKAGMQSIETGSDGLWGVCPEGRYGGQNDAIRLTAI